MAEQTSYNITVKHPLPVHHRLPRPLNHEGTIRYTQSCRYIIAATICIRLDEKIASITRIRLTIRPGPGDGGRFIGNNASRFYSDTLFYTFRDS